MLTEPFMLRALLAALLLAPVCGLLGIFVTARKMAFFSDTISHGALVGIAVGLWLGMSDLTLPLLFCSYAVALFLVWLKNRTELSSDTLMALLLSGSVAIGIIILARLKQHYGEIQRYLFGDILGIAPGDLWLAAVLLVAVVGWVVWSINPLVLSTANEELAHVCGVRVQRLNYVFILVMTTTVALTLRLLGIILVTALLVIPPAAAKNLSSSVRQQICLSVFLAVIAGVGGTLLSYPLEVPCGPAIVLVSIALFAVSLALGVRRRVA